MKKFLSCLLVVTIFLSLFTMVTFAQTNPPNIVAEYEFANSDEGWYVFNGTNLAQVNGHICASNENKSWVSPAKDIYNIIKTEGAGTYVINAQILTAFDPGEEVTARMMLRTDKEYSFSTNHNGNYYGDIGTLTYCQPNTWTNISGSVKILESDIQKTTGDFILCFDSLFNLAVCDIYVDNVTICKLDEDDITNGDFSSDTVGWRNWGGKGNFTVEYGSDGILGSIFKAYYLKASPYGSIVTNVDQIIAKYGCTKYKLSFRIKVEEDYLENLEKIGFLFARNKGDYNYWLGMADATALEDGNWVKFEKIIDMATMVDEEQTLYDVLAPYQNQVFLRYHYFDAEGVSYNEEHSYYVTDVSFKPVITAERIVLQKTSMLVETGWDGNNPATVYPINTTNKTLYWTSSSSSVATVERNTGFIVARGAGTAVITAHLVDGTQKASFIINVKDSALIRRGSDGLLEVVLGVTESGQERIWKCIDEDVVFYDQYGANPAGDIEHQHRLQRCAYNYYETIISNQERYGQKEYSDAELKLLYIIDPYGVAKYVNLKALNGFSTVNEGLEYKDRIFRILFNRDPIFHTKDKNDNWVVVNKNNISSRYGVYSEAESLFGYHMIDGEDVMIAIASLLYDIISFALAIACPTTIPVLAAGEILIETLFYEYAYSQAVIQDEVNSFLINDYIDGQLQDFFDSRDLGWAYTLATDFINLYEVYERASDIPEYNKKIYTCCADFENYIVKITLGNGEQYKFSEISNILL